MAEESIISPSPNPAEEALKEWGHKFCTSEIDEALLRNTLVSLEKSAQPPSPSRFFPEEEEATHKLFPPNENGARIDTPQQQSLLMAYATHLDQRKELIQEALTLALRHGIPFSSFAQVLKDARLGSAQVTAFEKDLAAAIKEGPQPNPGHRYGVSFERTANQQNPLLYEMHFVADKETIITRI